MITCANEDHTRPTRAVARLSWPDGRFRPTTGCVGCTKWHVTLSLDEGHPVLVAPIPREDNA